MKIKRIVLLLECICIVYTLCCVNVKNIYAMENKTPIDSEITLVYAGYESVHVEDSEGEDVTREFIKDTRDYYNSNNIEKIKDYICEKGYIIADEKLSMSTMESSTFKSIRKDFYFILDSKNGIGRIEVGSELSGGVWYKRASGEVVRTSTPTYRVTYIGAGAGYNIGTNDFLTGSYVSNGTGYFWGECSFVGNFNETLNGVPMSFTEHFGKKRVNFNTSERGIL